MLGRKNEGKRKIRGRKVVREGKRKGWKEGSKEGGWVGGEKGERDERKRDDLRGCRGEKGK